MRILFVLLSCSIILSCKKFKHANQTLPACTNCAFADSLSGTYRGHAYGVEVPYLWDGDSVTLQVEHIFMKDSKYEDSTVMHFRTAFKYDSATDTVYDTVQILSNSGLVLNNAWNKYVHFSSNDISYLSAYNYYIIKPDKVRLHVMGSGPGSPVQYIDGAFARL